MKDLPKENEELTEAKDPGSPVRDFTEERKIRCRPVVKKMLEMMLAEGLLYTDKDYVQKIVAQQLEAVFKTIVADHFNTIMETMQISLAESLDAANANLWKKGLDEITMKDIDENLKK